MHNMMMMMMLNGEDYDVPDDDKYDDANICSAGNIFVQFWGETNNSIPHSTKTPTINIRV